MRKSLASLWKRLKPAGCIAAVKLLYRCCTDFAAVHEPWPV
jgi:hypothetical protein